jgi:hypothetical protein
MPAHMFSTREDHQQQPTDLPGPEAGPLPARDVPDLGHRVLGHLGQAAGAPGEGRQANHQADAAAA